MLKFLKGLPSQFLSSLKSQDQGPSPEWPAVAILIFLTGAALLVRLRFTVWPFEDAAMLMRYAQHLADGHGVVWNIGGPPVDGATDFGFMVVVAGLYKLGLSLETATYAPGLIAHLGTVLLLYFGPRKLFDADRRLCLFIALWAAFGPGIVYTEAYFGTAFFAASACVAWALAWAYMIRGGLGYAVGFAFSSLACGLIRPEGVILCSLMMAGILVYQGLGKSRSALLIFVGVFAVLGGTYFLWRWHYFGHPLPNPFYKKGGGQLYPGTLRESFKGLFIMGYPFLPCLVLIFYPLKRVREGLAVLIPVLGFTLVWVLMSNEMNLKHRFQYPMIPVLLFSCSRIIQLLIEFVRTRAWLNNPKRAKTAGIVCLVLGIGLLARQYSENEGRDHRRDGRYDIGVILEKYKDQGYVMAVSESGLLPLYSGWIAVDLWGLNDPYIARQGMVTDEYLDRYNPALVQLHAHYSPGMSAPSDNEWDRMILSAVNYTEANSYRLAAVYGRRPDDTHWYFVRPDCPDAQAIINELRGLDYRWGYHGKTSKQFFPPSN